MLKILVLGSAAGGGSPQWNCNCAVCRRMRANGAAARTQSSLAVSAGKGIWFLLNASPDLRQQILQNPQLHPQHGSRHSPVAGAVLTNGDVDHVAGLLTLRETQPLAIYATKRVHEVLRANSIFNVLNPEFVSRRELRLDRAVELSAPDGTATGIEVEPFAVPGKVALYLEDPNAKNFGSTAEDTIALKVSSRGNGAYFYYVPGCAAVPDGLADRLRGAPLVFFDGTLWRDDEMITNGVGVKTGSRMGHMSNSGPEGTMAVFSGLDVQRKVFIHINNTNPILLEDSPERAKAEAAGWEVAFDGMEISL